MGGRYGNFSAGFCNAGQICLEVQQYSLPPGRWLIVMNEKKSFLKLSFSNYSSNHGKKNLLRPSVIFNRYFFSHLQQSENIIIDDYPESSTAFWQAIVTNVSNSLIRQGSLSHEKRVALARYAPLSLLLPTKTRGRFKIASKTWHLTSKVILSFIVRSQKLDIRRNHYIHTHRLAHHVKTSSL